MNRADYGYSPLSWDQYQAIIQHGSFPNVPEPMLNRPDYDSLIAVMQSANIDPRLPLSFTWAEGHDGTDPGLVAASVNNLGGIKFSGAPGTYDSKIPADTGGTYAGFPDLTAYWQEWVRVMNNSIIGPSFNSGDLVGAVEHYTNGPGTGHNKVDKFMEYQTAYPPQGTQPDTGVYGEDLIAKLETQIGHADSGTFDTINGNHPWAFWCLAGVQAAAIDCGLPYTLRPSAVAKYQAAFDQGLIQTGEPEHGAQVFFGTQFYAPDGHTGLWNADKRQLLGTLTDGTGVGYRGWGPGTVGYLGWMRIPGVVAPRRSVPIPTPDPPMDHNFIPPGNPWNTNTDPNHQVAVGGANKREYLKAPEVFQFPVTNEFEAYVLDGKMSGPLIIQVYENLTTAYDKATDTLSVLKPGARIIPKEARP